MSERLQYACDEHGWCDYTPCPQCPARSEWPPAHGSAHWLEISTLDRSKMDFVLVTEYGAVRLHLWNPHRYCWERAYPIGSIVHDGEDCYNPTHWMPCPDAPND